MLKRQSLQMYFFVFIVRGMRYRSWLRYYTTSREVAGSIPDVIEFFSWPNPSSCTMVLRSTQPLTKMRNLPGDKGRPARKADNLTVICEPIV
jgi:hypothetical protein